MDSSTPGFLPCKWEGCNHKPRKLEETRNRFSPRGWGELSPAHTWVSDLQPPELERVKFLLFELHQISGDLLQYSGGTQTVIEINFTVSFFFFFLNMATRKLLLMNMAGPHGELGSFSKERKPPLLSGSLFNKVLNQNHTSHTQFLGL